ncbi:copper transport protein ATOX1 homolog [Chrysoperla carnea]|uniref:copper transport protein ATOX1 homolog n=1 Tax=Chrysoperla carnea TaxID=189513 RepID=UPI001D069765|nr:copper transport protein ATOX1 homolog [Chrysoperla carnea]
MPVFVYKVDMTCDGCANRIRKKLSGLNGQGLEDVDIDLENKLVKVTVNNFTAEQILAEIKKTGKEASIVPA